MEQLIPKPQITKAADIFPSHLRTDAMCFHLFIKPELWKHLLKFLKPFSVEILMQLRLGFFSVMFLFRKMIFFFP